MGKCAMKDGFCNVRIHSLCENGNSLWVPVCIRNHAPENQTKCEPGLPGYAFTGCQGHDTVKSRVRHMDLLSRCASDGAAHGSVTRPRKSICPLGLSRIAKMNGRSI
jgi:hypothetical protein